MVNDNVFIHDVLRIAIIAKREVCFFAEEDYKPGSDCVNNASKCLASHLFINGLRNESFVFPVVIGRAEKVVVERGFSQSFTMIYPVLVKHTVHYLKNVFVKRSMAYKVTDLASAVVRNQTCIRCCVPFFSIEKITISDVVIVEIVAFGNEKHLAVLAIGAPIAVAHSRYQFWKANKNTFFYNIAFADMGIILRLVCVKLWLCHKIMC